MIQVGLVGCGRWGRHILRDLRSLGAEVSVCVPSEEGRARARDLGAVSVHARPEDLPEAAGYVVASPTVTHAAVVEALIPRGRPIYVEKPLTVETASAERILRAAPNQVFCMDKWRWHPGIEMLRDLARGGALGELRALRSFRLGWGNPHADVDAIWILIPHDLSITLEVLGTLPPAVAAFTAAPGRADGLLAVLEAPDGPRVTLEVSAEHPVSRRALTVIGSTGSAQLGDSYDDAVLIRRPGDDGRGEKIQVSTEFPLLRELRGFMEHLAGGPPPRSSAADASEGVRRIAELRALAGLPA
jgi:predicted dehydrogenase